jgi:hypothetical protein
LGSNVPPKTLLKDLILKIKEARLENIILASLLVYVTVHLLEEGLLGFPAWAEMYWRIPNYTTSKWLIHNVYFISVLLIGYFIYHRNRQRFLPLGLGIVIWGFSNSLAHIGSSLIWLSYSPGLFTGLIWVLLFVLARRRVREVGEASRGLMRRATLVGLPLYWGVPMALFINIDKMRGV